MHIYLVYLIPIVPVLLWVLWILIRNAEKGPLLWAKKAIDWLVTAFRNRNNSIEFGFLLMGLGLLMWLPLWATPVSPGNPAEGFVVWLFGAGFATFLIGAYRYLPRGLTAMG